MVLSRGMSTGLVKITVSEVAVAPTMAGSLSSLVEKSYGTLDCATAVERKSSDSWHKASSFIILVFLMLCVSEDGSC